MSGISYLTHLACPECGSNVPADQIQTFCPSCISPWLAKYDLAAVRQVLDRDLMQSRPKGMWRWAELLPVREPANRITLGEGDTPLLKLERLGAQLGLENLYLKEEGVNPTGSFKARGLAAAVAKAKESGHCRKCRRRTGSLCCTGGHAGLRGDARRYAARQSH